MLSLDVGEELSRVLCARYSHRECEKVLKHVFGRVGRLVVPWVGDEGEGRVLDDEFAFVVTDERGGRAYGVVRYLGGEDGDVGSVFSDEVMEDACGEMVVLCGLSREPCVRSMGKTLKEVVESLRFGGVARSLSFTSLVSMSPGGSPRKGVKGRNEVARPVVSFPMKGWGYEMLVDTAMSFMHGEQVSGTAKVLTTDIPYLIASLSPRCLTSVLAALMEEKRVVLTSKNTAKLSRLVIAFAVLLLPIKWPHALIPLLSKKLLDVLAAPVPYLVGVPAHLEHAVNFGELDQVLWVDIDTSDALAYRTSSTCSLLMKQVDDATSIENLNSRIPRRPRSRLEKKFTKLGNTPCDSWTADMVKGVESAVMSFYQQILAKCPSQRKETMGASRIFYKAWEEPYRGFVEAFCQSQMYISWKEELEDGKGPKDGKNAERREATRVAPRKQRDVSNGEPFSRKENVSYKSELSLLTKQRRRTRPSMIRRRKVQSTAADMDELPNLNERTLRTTSRQPSPATSLKSLLTYLGNDTKDGGLNSSAGALRWKSRTKRATKPSGDDLTHAKFTWQHHISNHPPREFEFASQPMLQINKRRDNYRQYAPRLHSDLSCATEAVRRVGEDPVFNNAHGFGPMATLV